MLARSPAPEWLDPDAALPDVRRETAGQAEVQSHAGGDDSDGRRVAKEVGQASGGGAPIALSTPGEAAEEGPGGAVRDAGPSPLRVPIEIGKSVGREGENADADVLVVGDRLQALGFANRGGSDLAVLAGAIERFQAEALGWSRQDGRVDPGGKTLAALSAGKASADKGVAKDASTPAARDPLPSAGGGTAAQPAPARPPDAAIQAWATQQPSDNPGLAAWLLAAEAHGFVAFTTRRPEKGKAAETVDPKSQMQAFVEGKTVHEASGAADAPLVGALKTLTAIVRGRARRWLQAPSGGKNPLQVGWVVRDDRRSGFRGHTFGEAVDLSGGYDWNGSKGPAQVIQTLTDLRPGKYKIGLPFQGEFFPPEEYWGESREHGQGGCRQGRHAGGRHRGVARQVHRRPRHSLLERGSQTGMEDGPCRRQGGGPAEERRAQGQDQGAERRGLHDRRLRRQRQPHPHHPGVKSHPARREDRCDARGARPAPA